MAKRLFVGGLPYSVTNSQLEEMFSQFGAVTSCNVISDRYSGQSKGFGFVEMEKDEEADKAIEKLNGSEVGGRKIAVNVARPMEERKPRDDFRSDRNSGGRDRSFGRRDEKSFRRGR